jgi:4'-phosphopantetheinyl transferase EntD
VTMIPIDDVEAWLACSLPPGCAVAVGDRTDRARLLTEEAPAVERAIVSRRVEFARGRACARAALAKLGCAEGAIPMGPKRQPLWPPGFVGSITHTGSLVAAAAAPVSRARALGIDAELERPLPPEVRRLVLQPSEMRDASGGTLETVVFSAKESVYKALFPLHGRWIDFLEVEVRLEDGGRFGARALEPSTVWSPSLLELRGRFVVTGGYVLTVAYLPPV